MMKIGVIIAAAGASRRFGDGRSKLDEDLGGRPVLQRTVELFLKRDDVAHILVAGPAADDAFEDFRRRHGDKLGLLGAAICRGGKTHRWETVKAALPELPADCTHLAVHDGARPCAPFDMLDRVFGAAAKHMAVAPGVELTDTIKRVAPQEIVDEDVDPLDAILGSAAKANVKVKIVEATIPRQGLVAVQTPQVFEISLLKRAYEQADLSSTDDAGLVERLGERVIIVEGDPRNIKITRPADVPLAMAILGLRPSQGRPTHLKF